MATVHAVSAGDAASVVSASWRERQLGYARDWGIVGALYGAIGAVALDTLRGKGMIRWFGTRSWGPLPFMTASAAVGMVGLAVGLWSAKQNVTPEEVPFSLVDDLKVLCGGLLGTYLGIVGVFGTEVTAGIIGLKRGQILTPSYGRAIWLGVPAVATILGMVAGAMLVCHERNERSVKC